VTYDYDLQESIFIKVVFESAKDEQEFHAFRKKHDIMPCRGARLDFVRYKFQAANYYKEDATKILEWLKTKKAKHKKMAL
jgi:hypothetical protein